MAKHLVSMMPTSKKAFTSIRHEITEFPHTTNASKKVKIVTFNANLLEESLITCSKTLCEKKS